MNMARTVTLVAWAVVVGGTTTAAQSLADVARKSGDRQEPIHGARTYTNADLPRDANHPRGAAAETAPPPAVAAPATATPSPAPPATNSENDSATAGRDRAADEYWRTQSQGLTARLDDARSRVRAFETRLDEINEEPHSPALARERTLTERSLARARRDLTTLTDALRNFERMSNTRPRP
jgi:hypothetical protein